MNTLEITKDKLYDAMLSLRVAEINAKLAEKKFNIAGEAYQKAKEEQIEAFGLVHLAKQKFLDLASYKNIPV